MKSSFFKKTKRNVKAYGHFQKNVKKKCNFFFINLYNSDIKYIEYRFNDHCLIDWFQRCICLVLHKLGFELVKPATTGFQKCENFAQKNYLFIFIFL